MAAEVRANASSFEIGAIRTLFETRPYGVFARFDVTADGQRFIVPFEAGDLHHGDHLGRELAV